MRILKTLTDLDQWRHSLDTDLGFVPTMGALHEGHLSLIRKAKAENDTVIVSIYVNPTQFNNPEDLAKYPRTIEADLDLLRSVSTDAVYLPSTEDLYPQAVESDDYSFGPIEKVMEGSYRAGHFQGVATIVHRFFDLIKPVRAYFGEKDFQQLQIIKELVFQKKLPIQIIPVAISREDSGLARSSRNERLTEDQRRNAAVIFRSLEYAREHWSEQAVNETVLNMKSMFRDLEDAQVEYIQFVDETSLQQVDDWSDAEHVRAFIAVFFGEVRLIDNLPIF